MKFLLVLLTLILITEPSHAIDWYCMENLQYRPIESYDCNEKIRGKAYCDHDNDGTKDVCGKFSNADGNMVVYYKTTSGERTQLIGPVRTRPETLAPKIVDGVSETTRTPYPPVKNRTPRRAKTNNSNNLLANRYPPRTASFSESRRTADSYTNNEWLGMSMLSKANYIHSVSEALLAAHNIDISPRILTCKALRESCFRPQDTAPGTASSAAGLSQATKSSIRDLFQRGLWFHSKVPGFENIESADTYYNNMAGSIPAQLEMGLAILNQKGRDNRTNNIKTMLQRYYGNTASTNADYANRIFNCAQCIVDSGGTITESCLKMARRSCFP